MITLPCRLRFLMQTNLFNGPVMQTLVFTLILWILDRVKDDSIVIAGLVPYLIREHVSACGNLVNTLVIARPLSGSRQSSGGDNLFFIYCSSFFPAFAI